MRHLLPLPHLFHNILTKISINVDRCAEVIASLTTVYFDSV